MPGDAATVDMAAESQAAAGHGPGAEIIRLPGDRRLFVAGMYWRHEDHKPRRRQLLDGVRDRDFWVAVRRTASRSIQSGFCPPLVNERGKPLKGKVVSLAATVAEVLQEPWLGLFDLGDGRYWYIAVRDNYEILPDGDVIGDYDTVERIRREHAGYGEWSVFVDGGIDKIAELVRKSKRPWPVRDIRKRPWVMPALACAVLAGVAAGGIVAWHRHEEALERARIAAMQRRLAVMRAMEAKKAAANVPWLRKASPTVFLRQCDRVMDGVPLSVDGWLLKSVTCSQRPAAGSGPHAVSVDVRADWSRGAGATALYRPEGLLEDKGDRVSGPWRGASPWRGADSATVIPADKASRLRQAFFATAVLYGQAQGLGVSVDIASGQGAASAMPGAGRPSPGSQPDGQLWKGLPVRISGPAVILRYSGGFWDAVPGLRLESLTLQPSAGSAKAGGAGGEGGGGDLGDAVLNGTLYVRSTGLRPAMGEMTHAQ